VLEQLQSWAAAEGITALRELTGAIR